MKRPRFENEYQRDLDNAPDADDFPDRKQIDREKEANLVRAAQGRDPRLAEVARAKLLRAHRHRIDYQAKGKQNQFFDKDEAFQAGVVGYFQGLESFDPSKGKKAGFPGLLFHDLRRSAVRTMEQRGVPRSVAMKITGHKTENVYRRYAIVSDADLKTAASALARNTALELGEKTTTATG